MKTLNWMIPTLAALALSACGGGTDNSADGMTRLPGGSDAGPTQETSFREFVLAAIEAGPESEPAQVDGRTWIDTAEDDPAAFDTVLSPIAE